MVAKGRRKSAVEVIVGTFYYSGTNLDLIPGINNIPSRPLCALEIFVVMEIELAIHRDRFDQTGPLIIIGVVATATTGKIGFGKLEAQNSFHEVAT